MSRCGFHQARIAHRLSHAWPRRDTAGSRRGRHLRQSARGRLASPRSRATQAAQRSLAGGNGTGVAAHASFRPSSAISTLAPKPVLSPEAAEQAVISGLPPDAVHEESRYIERELLGEGGMGRIYLCRDERVGRDVAMKVLRTKYAKAPDTLARFVRESAHPGPAGAPVDRPGLRPDASPKWGRVLHHEARPGQDHRANRRRALPQGQGAGRAVPAPQAAA